MNILSKKSGVNTRVFPIYTPLQVLSLVEWSEYSSNETKFIVLSYLSIHLSKDISSLSQYKLM